MGRIIILLFIINIFAPTLPQGVPESETTSHAIYDGCGTMKTCFGLPAVCVAQQNCEAIVTAVILNGKFLFELKSSFKNVRYVAVGLSTDVRMGDDASMECIPEAGSIRAYSSWISARPNLGLTREGVSQDTISFVRGSYVDGTIYCKFEREPVTIIQGKEFDLVNNTFHLLLAIGDSVTATTVGRHNLGLARIASSEPVNFTEVSVIRGTSTLLFRLHGAFMLTAWIGAASVGILLARYFKQTWVGSSLCGKDQWFAWHRFFMIATWSLTIAAFVIIFVELGDWSAEDNPHAILGTITTILCFIQPFMALFRPGPTHKNRPIFNWAHWLVGNSAYVLAIVTIFFAVELTAAQLPQWFYWILGAFVIFHVIMHLIFSIAACVGDESSVQRVNFFPKRNISPQSSVKELKIDAPVKLTDVSPGDYVEKRKFDAPYSGLRKGLLTIYLLIMLSFVVATVVITLIVPF